MKQLAQARGWEVMGPGFMVWAPPCNGHILPDSELQLQLEQQQPHRPSAAPSSPVHGVARISPSFKRGQVSANLTTQTQGF